MEVKVSKYSTVVAFEYFIYAALVLETGLAVFIFKVIALETELFYLRIGLAILYFGFLAWGVFQLNRLRRAKMQLQSIIEPEPMPSAPQAEASERLPEPAEPPPTVFGLTRAQFVIVLIVFVTAVLGFSWALTHLGR
jgi:hypothetical protein